MLGGRDTSFSYYGSDVAGADTNGAAASSLWAGGGLPGSWSSGPSGDMTPDKYAFVTSNLDRTATNLYNGLLWFGNNVLGNVSSTSGLIVNVTYGKFPTVWYGGAQKTVVSTMSPLWRRRHYAIPWATRNTLGVGSLQGIGRDVWAINTLAQPSDGASTQLLGHFSDASIVSLSAGVLLRDALYMAQSGQTFADTNVYRWPGVQLRDSAVAIVAPSAAVPVPAATVATMCTLPGAIGNGTIGTCGSPIPVGTSCSCTCDYGYRLVGTAPVCSPSGQFATRQQCVLTTMDNGFKLRTSAATNLPTITETQLAVVYTPAPMLVIISGKQAGSSPTSPALLHTALQHRMLAAKVRRSLCGVVLCFCV